MSPRTPRRSPGTTDTSGHSYTMGAEGVDASANTDIWAREPALAASRCSLTAPTRSPTSRSRATSWEVLASSARAHDHADRPPRERRHRRAGDRRDGHGQAGRVAAGPA